MKRALWSARSTRFSGCHWTAATNGPGLAGERLDEVVRRGGERNEPRREVLHRLVVPGVDVRAVRGGESGCEREGPRSAPRDADGVRGVGRVVSVLSREGVLDAPRALRREVLPERPAERDVDDLEAATDAEDRPLRRVRPARGARSRARRVPRSSRPSRSPASRRSARDRRRARPRGGARRSLPEGRPPAGRPPPPPGRAPAARSAAR